MNNAPLQRGSAGEMELFLHNWELKKELANTLLKSGFLPGAFKTPEQVIAVMLKGQELGIPAMEALNSINVVNGKPTVSPQLMLALARRSRELEDLKIERTNDSVVVTIKRKNQSPHTTRFGVTEARALNLQSKDNYTKQPFTMYQWRALAANLRVTFPDIIGGLYTPEEMGADVMVTEEGNQVLVEGAEPEVADTGEYAEEGGTIEAEGTSFRTFDPSKERLTFGKYAGMYWSEVPDSYLQWLQGNATRRDLTAKVEATMKWRETGARMAEQEGSVVDELFEPKNQGQSQGEQRQRGNAPSGAGQNQPQSTQHDKLIDVLSASLESIAAQGRPDDLRKWSEENRERIDALSEQERSTLRKVYNKVLKQAREQEKKIS